MTKDTGYIAAAELRRKAEEKVDTPHLKASAQNEIYTSRMLHELHVHQVELEMQNEELRLTFAEKSDLEVHLRNIIQQTPAGYFHIDREGRILDVNDAWLRMHGYDSKDEVTYVALEPDKPAKDNRYVRRVCRYGSKPSIGYVQTFTCR